MTGIAGLTRRTASTIFAAPSSVTCAELMRTTSIPASKRPRTNSSLARKSDNVATILVFFSPHIQLLVKLYRFKSKLPLESGIRLYPKLFRHSIAHQSFTHEHPTDRTRIVPNIFRRNPKTDTSTSRKSRKHPQHRQRSDYPQPDKRHEGHAFVIPAYKNSEKPGYTPQDPPIRIEFTHISHPSESRDDPGAENKFSYPPGFGYLCRRQDAVRQFSRTSSHNCSRLSLSL